MNTTERAKLGRFLESSMFKDAQVSLRGLLRRHLISLLGGDWEEIHNEYGMYTITCRAKAMARTLEKCDRLKDGKITQKNFYRKLPDLVAARLVVVDPDDIFRLAEKVRNMCIEPLFCKPDSPLVCAKVRHGRLSMYNVRAFEDTRAYTITTEETGYCSVHFVFRTGAEFYSRLCHDEEMKDLRALDLKGLIGLDAWHVEIQVRTIMDEAWGETDHFVRYEDSGLRDDPEIRDQFAALASYLQAANHHVSLIRNAARRRKKALA